jgi:hypothetical protein
VIAPSGMFASDETFSFFDPVPTPQSVAPMQEID